MDNPKYLDGESILEAIAIQQGIFVERATGIYSFSHLTLQEYLTAQHISDDNKLRLDQGNSPEFDSWRWVNYWYPVEQVIEFKRDVYRSALEQLQPPLERYVALSKL